MGNNGNWNSFFHIVPCTTLKVHTSNRVCSCIVRLQKCIHSKSGFGTFQHPSSPSLSPKPHVSTALSSFIFHWRSCLSRTRRKLRRWKLTAAVDSPGLFRPYLFDIVPPTNLLISYVVIQVHRLTFFVILLSASLSSVYIRLFFCCSSPVFLLFL